MPQPEAQPLKVHPKTCHIWVEKTWTHDFFCLASSSADNVPRRAEKLALQNAGLGRRPGRGGHSLIWPKRVCAAQQGMVFRVLRLKQGMQFHY